LELETIELVRWLLKRKLYKISSIQNSEIIHKSNICPPTTLAQEVLAQTTIMATRKGASQSNRSQRKRHPLMSSSGRYRKIKVSKKTISERRLLNPRLVEWCTSQ
jgi:hypothetical protein